jgi:deoxycytidylate deaminase
MPELVPCLKQTTKCVIVRADGRLYAATNLCAVKEIDTCPRVMAGSATGTGYALCGSTHAEANAAVLAAESLDVEGEAYLYGHTWMCKSCQDALIAVNVRTFHIGRNMVFNV